MAKYKVVPTTEGHEDVTMATVIVLADNEQDAMEKVQSFIDDTDMTDLHAWEA